MSSDKQSPTQVSRRAFMGTAATAAGFTIVPRRVLGGTGYQAPSDTVNVAVVGYIHGMGTSNLLNVIKSDNVVALCDLDESVAAKEALKRRDTIAKVPKAVDVQGLPRDAREAEGHRRGARGHARPLARR